MAGRPFHLRSPQRNDEAAGQKHVVRMLRAYMPGPPVCWWCASINGVRLPMHTAMEAKRMGMERGAPDLSFVFRDGITRVIDLKLPDGSLTKEQKALREMMGAHNFAVCTVYPLYPGRTWAEVKGVLEGWMAPLGDRLLTDAEAIKLQREVA